jgi:hypothetical protein
LDGIIVISRNTKISRAEKRGTSYNVPVKRENERILSFIKTVS